MEDSANVDEVNSSLLKGQNHEINEVSYLTYRVKAGDMIGLIADEYGITQDTIISVNGIRQSRLLQVGQYLKIPSIPGILYTVKK
ncbi:MAG: LysM peptidoglycan-binding domain-containing protein, partial [Treponema sp.]|nr:LysM peptidoglycan-binding domain-containing protein [Treponema sp.]